MVIYANEFETKEKQKLPEIKKLTIYIYRKSVIRLFRSTVLHTLG